jgi:hypothetical protein
MRRSLVFVPVVFATTLALAVGGGPAVAITNGDLDGDLHPNVGVIGCRTRDGTIVATGTVELVSPTAALTAAHVIDRQEPVFGCRSDFFVSFDPVFAAGSSKRYAVADLVKHPLYESSAIMNPGNRRNDIGLLLLRKPIRDIEPVRLPTERLLDELTSTGAIQAGSFVTVGYGAYQDCSACPPGVSYPFGELVFDDTRRFAPVSYNGHGSFLVWLQMNHTATGQGGFCVGDSGGATFLLDPGSDPMIIGVTSWASTCQSTGAAHRLDIASVRSFLADHGVPLP